MINFTCIFETYFAAKVNIKPKRSTVSDTEVKQISNLLEEGANNFIVSKQKGSTRSANTQADFYEGLEAGKNH